MSTHRTSRRIKGGLVATAATAATVVGIGAATSPEPASATDVTIDLNAVGAALEMAQGSSGDASDPDFVASLYSIAQAVEVDGSSLDSGLAATTDPNAETVIDPTTEGIEDIGTEETGLEDEIDAIDIANERPSDVGETVDGRTVYFPTKGTFSSGFGARNGSVHEGIDIANSLGTPIRAVMDGTVVNAGPATGYGNWVVLQHGDGSKSIYGHMSKWNVSVGQKVRAGDQIAVIGNEGQSTGPHLHFEILPDGRTPVNPVTWFAAQQINVNSARV